MFGAAQARALPTSRHPPSTLIDSQGASDISNFAAVSVSGDGLTIVASSIGRSEYFAGEGVVLVWQRLPSHNSFDNATYQELREAENLASNYLGSYLCMSEDGLTIVASAARSLTYTVNDVKGYMVVWRRSNSTEPFLDSSLVRLELSDVDHPRTLSPMWISTDGNTVLASTTVKVGSYYQKRLATFDNIDRHF
uniref:Uncharacterized protein n=1 Tax=Palpitomonas bilix TaxID=652834 RepID=A0A7S3D9R0_9EUKA|mmetsp:Transcript_27688/g.70715  ORF Transcript_27688/g.70715 Transcript_27688/m.70715 type:complete len:194 (+) Transcript_27688:321-902(+)